MQNQLNKPAPKINAERDEIFTLISQETARQTDKIGLIPSENIVSPAVSEALASFLSNKYAEGYPKSRSFVGKPTII